MIDYEITVNVYELTREEKMRVQDAFFKLGFTWWDGKGYRQLDKGCYTNKMKFGEVTQNIMWAVASTKPTHTVDQLLELAGMKQKLNMLPFVLEQALAGDSVVTRNGLKATQITVFDIPSDYKVVAVINGQLETFLINGKVVDGENMISTYDLFMEPKTHIVNGFEVPKPATEQPKKAKIYYAPNPSVGNWYSGTEWEGDAVDFTRLERNIVFLNKEDAIANAKAMVGIDPYGDSNGKDH